MGDKARDKRLKGQEALAEMKKVITADIAERIARMRERGR